MRTISYIAFLCLVFTNLVSASDVGCCASNNQMDTNQHSERVSQLKSSQHKCPCPHSKQSQPEKKLTQIDDSQTIHCEDCDCQHNLKTQNGILFENTDVSNSTIYLFINTYLNADTQRFPNSIFYPPKITLHHSIAYSVFTFSRNVTAHPIFYRGGVTLMQLNDNDINSLHIFY